MTYKNGKPVALNDRVIGTGNTRPGIITGTVMELSEPTKEKQNGEIRLRAHIRTPHDAPPGIGTVEIVREMADPSKMMLVQDEEEERLKAKL